MRMTVAIVYKQLTLLSRRLSPPSKLPLLLWSVLDWPPPLSFIILVSPLNSVGSAARLLVPNGLRLEDATAARALSVISLTVSLGRSLAVPVIVSYLAESSSSKSKFDMFATDACFRRRLELLLKLEPEDSVAALRVRALLGDPGADVLRWRRYGVTAVLGSSGGGGVIGRREEWELVDAEW
jgi:hypothetical protein